eukprot:scaffold206038_cov38-Prasinocladus_malaysianus.AAC.1
MLGMTSSALRPSASRALQICQQRDIFRGHSFAVPFLEAPIKPGSVAVASSSWRPRGPGAVAAATTQCCSTGRR